MYRTILILVSLMFAFVASAIEPWRNGTRQPLWEEGHQPYFQEHQQAVMTDEPATNRMPYLEWFEKPAKPNGGCAILVSGGSYQNCCDLGLIRFWRERLTDLGFQCVNLVYRTPRPNNLPIYQTAWADGQRAVRLVREAAAKRGFSKEKIGVVGMSAGGHLTCLLATSSQTPAYAGQDKTDRLDAHLNWAIAFAPAYNTLTGEAGGQTRDEGISVMPHIGPALKFDSRTCPISFHHGGRDPWTPNGSTLAYRELRKRKVPSELHLYADRSHGAHGFDRGIEFLRQIGALGPVPKEESIWKHYPSDGEWAVHTRQNVWPNAKTTPNYVAKQGDAFIEWFVPKNLKTKAIQIVYSGGGYQFNNPDEFEVKPVRRFLNEKGMAVVTLRYRTPYEKNAPKYRAAWQDLQRAIRLVREQAPQYGLDPTRIGIMGCSAGGHLTLMAATSSRRRAYEPIDATDDLSAAVQWAVPIYPAYVLSDGIDHPNTTRGNDEDVTIVPDFDFDQDTCPMVFFHGDADAWASMNSVKVWEYLRTKGIQCDLHTLAKRGHCFMNNASPGTLSYSWMESIWDFLSRKGFNR